ncbi:MAG: phosphoenolpyruvate carboxykinase (ATP) [Candidatus Marinimicrobia bacterium]|nr:phosphoenolpyruvate carboxykinase (ATP) [Candidatus Neomarinimicrobiota bacterium]
MCGTEGGQDKKPIPTFSNCFGAPFIVIYLLKYALTLKENVKKYKSEVWLVNTE